MLNLCLFLIVAAFGTDWSSHALRLTGESNEVRSEAILVLKSMKDLKPLLKRELLGPSRALALDVIAALTLKDLLPELSDLSRNDENGSVYLTMNTLVDSANREGFIELYRKRLKSPTISMPSRAILLDTLGRMGVELPTDEVEDFLKSPFHEVRRSALYYARLLIVRHGKRQYLPVVEKAARLAPRQLREQAEELLKEAGRKP